MKLKTLLEIELGKDPEFEKTIESRKRMLDKKIAGKKGEEEKILRKIEKKSDDMLLGKLPRNISPKEVRELVGFMEYAIQKLQEYEEKEIDVNIPIAGVPMATGMALSMMSTKLTKNEMKMLEGIVKLKKPKNTQELIQLITTLHSKENISMLKKDAPGLDIKDLRTFVRKVSKDPELKKRYNRFRNSLDRLIGLKAETEYLSSMKGTKKIRL